MKNRDSKFSPDYETFETQLFEDNPGFDENMLEFFERKKRGIYYYKLDLLNNVSVKDLDTVGYTYLLRRRVLKKTKIDTLYSAKGRPSHVYDALNGVPVGFIPTEDGHCIMFVRPKLTIFNFLFPICVIRMAVFILFHK